MWGLCFTHDGFFSFEDTAVLCLCRGAHLIVTCIIASDDIHRAFCSTSIEEMCVFSLWYVFVIKSSACKHYCLKDVCASSPPVQVLLTALKSNFLPFPSKSSSFLKPAWGGDQLSGTRPCPRVCASVLRLKWSLSSGRVMKCLLLVKPGSSFGLAVRWQGQDAYCYLHATCSGWTLWLLILPALLCVAAWCSGFFSHLKERSKAS